MKRLLFLLPLVVFGCGEASLVESIEERFAENLRPTEPTRSHETWYRDAEACLEMDGDFEAARWFLARRFTDDTSRLGGFFRPNIIVLKESHAAVDWVVRHEAIHHILEVHGVEGHTEPGHRDWPEFADCDGAP